MPHHRDQHADHDNHRPEKKPGKGPKEKEIAATLTAATIALAGASIAYPTLDEAGEAVAGIYTKMFELVVAGPARA